MTYSQPSLDAITSLSKPAYEAYLKIRDGYELWHCQSSWVRKAHWTLHKGPMMGGEDIKISDACAESLMSTAASLPFTKDELLNGWVVRYRLPGKA